MAKTRCIRVRITRQRVEALYELCSELQNGFRAESEHTLLLREHLLELHHKLAVMLQRNQEHYTLMLATHEAVAFTQLWHRADIQHDAYANIIINSVVKKMGSLAA